MTGAGAGPGTGLFSWLVSRSASAAYSMPSYSPAASLTSAEQALEPLRPAKQHLDHQQRSPVTDPGKRLGERGRAVHRFSHVRILDTGVDSWAVDGSNLQVISYWRQGGDDNP